MLTTTLPLYCDGRPFTRRFANDHGWTDRKLAALVRDGKVRRLVKSVYADALAPDTIELRAAAVALIARRSTWRGIWIARSPYPRSIRCCRRGSWTRRPCGRPRRVIRTNPGIVQARELIRYAEPLTESPGESWLRLRLLDAGFGRPVAQIPVKGRHRDLRIDLGYPSPMEDGRRLGLEYDSDQWHSAPGDDVRD